ncbi:MAG TPA: hypothetical protein VJA26_15930, partial [Gammaproteobacteria bacterium]|nr:hypothetical protein [Gammaproteobacteria bacterium]
MAGAFAAAAIGPAFGQVPIPMQEQIQLFNSLPPSQQQALIRELQRQLPPAQRQAVLGLLQQQQGDSQDGLDPEAAAALEDVLGGQGSGDGETGPLQPPRFRGRDTLVIEFVVREEQPVLVSLDEQTSFEEFRERLAEGNPYELDGAG